jgi:hypothetical protein
MQEAMNGPSRCLITDYRNVPGHHCGSTAMRNLIAHYCGLELSEAVVFGLGSGVDFALLETSAWDPGVMIFGRTATMEADLGQTLGLSYTEQTEPDDARAWELVREEVAAGRPTMLSGDALYLDYRDFRVHFPAHRFVLLGYDEEAREAFVADRIEEATQTCSYEALAASRNPPDFLSTVNLWGRFVDGRVERDLAEAFELAVAKACQRMLATRHNDAGSTSDGILAGVRASAGLGALGELAERLPDYLARDSGRALARYAGACIEAFGTGGGNFRRLYAGFLAEAATNGWAGVSHDDVATIEASAAAWTSLSGKLRAFAGEESPAGPTPETLAAMTDDIARIEALERRAFESLAAAVA